MTGDTAKDEDKFEALSRKIDVVVEGLHDHIRMVAEGAASQTEAVVRQVGELRNELREFRKENASEHKTMFDVLSDHETRISSLERRGS